MGVTVRSTSRIPQFKKMLKELGKKEIKVGVFGEDGAELVTIARANEFGVTIKPKNRKFLALPTENARGRRPRDFGDSLTFIPIAGGSKGLLVKETQGRGSSMKGARSEIYFILVKSVTIPERSFLRSGFDKNLNKIMDKVELYMNDVFEFRINPDTFANMIGLEFAGLIQEELRAINSPANAPLTVSNKKSDNPLVDTGRLVGAIRHEVE